LKKSIKTEESKEDSTGQKKDQVLQISHQKYHVLINLQIQGMPFQLKTLIDTGSDLNLLHKNIIPVKFWQKSQASVVGIGNIPTKIFFQIPEASLCFKYYCLKLKFFLTDIPIAFILGTLFLAAVSPHGSTMVTKDKPGYFISIPSGQKKIIVKLPFVSTPRTSDIFQTIKEKSLKIEELKTSQTGIRLKEQLAKETIQQKILLLKQ